jgi:hypothetical protein
LSYQATTAMFYGNKSWSKFRATRSARQDFVGGTGKDDMCRAVARNEVAFAKYVRTPSRRVRRAPGKQTVFTKSTPSPRVAATSNRHSQSLKPRWRKLEQVAGRRGAKAATPPARPRRARGGPRAGVRERTGDGRGRGGGIRGVDWQRRRGRRKRGTWGGALVAARDQRGVRAVLCGAAPERAARRLLAEAPRARGRGQRLARGFAERSELACRAPEHLLKQRALSPQLSLALLPRLHVPRCRVSPGRRGGARPCAAGAAPSQSHGGGPHAAPPGGAARGARPRTPRSRAAPP